jgi:hypothetical protein
MDIPPKLHFCGGTNPPAVIETSRYTIFRRRALRSRHSGLPAVAGMLGGRMISKVSRLARAKNEKTPSRALLEVFGGLT